MCDGNADVIYYFIESETQYFINLSVTFHIFNNLNACIFMDVNIMVIYTWRWIHISNLCVRVMFFVAATTAAAAVF